MPFRIPRRISVRAAWESSARALRHVILVDRWERAAQASEPIVLRSSLRSAESKVDLTLTRIHAQLLEVSGQGRSTDPLSVFQGQQRDSIKPADYKLTGAPYLMELAYFCSSAGYGIHTTEMILFARTEREESDATVASVDFNRR